MKDAEVSNNCIIGDDTAKFQSKFLEQQNLIENKLAVSPNIPHESLKKHFNDLNVAFQSLQKLYSNSSPYLRIYYRKIYQDALQGIQAKIQESESKLLPRKKFVFKGSRTKNKGETDLIKNCNDKVNARDDRDGDASDGPQTSCQFRNRTDETILIEDGDAEGKAVLLSGLHNCTVEIRGAPSTIHIAHVTNCRIFCGPVSTSVFVEAAHSCQFQLACQQLRIHESKNCEFFIHVTSKAIIEDSRNLKFGKYQWRYPEIEKDYQYSGLNRDVNNWKEIDDFNWLVSGKPSPNWTLLES